MALTDPDGKLNTWADVFLNEIDKATSDTERHEKAERLLLFFGREVERETRHNARNIMRKAVDEINYMETPLT